MTTREPNVSRGARIALLVTGGVVIVGGTTLAVLWNQSFCDVPKKRKGYVLEQAWMKSPDVLSPQRIARLKEGDRAMAAFAYVKDQDKPSWHLMKTKLDKGESLVLLPVTIGKNRSSVSTRCRIKNEDGEYSTWSWHRVPDPGKPDPDWFGWLFPAGYDKKLKRSEFWALAPSRFEPDEDS